MSRDRKRQLNWYQPDDTEAIARHLERMAGKGWLLEKVDNWLFTYRRAQPARVRYTVTFFPEASVFDPGLTRGQETYADYCQAAGWELAAAYALEDVQIIGIVSDVLEGEDQELAESLVEETQANYPHLLLNESIFYGLLTDVAAVPTTFFIDGEGVVLDTVVGARDKSAWEEMIHGFPEAD